MSVPIAARDVASAVGAVLVLSAVVSVIGTVIVPRKTVPRDSPRRARPAVPARLAGVLRRGGAVHRHQRAGRARAGRGISLRYAEFLDAVTRLREVDFPVEREAEAAWPHFVGWRVNYEQAAYALAMAVDSVPALWSGPRRRPTAPMPPLRPGPGALPL